MRTLRGHVLVLVAAVAVVSVLLREVRGLVGASSIMLRPGTVVTSRIRHCTSWLVFCSNLCMRTIDSVLTWTPRLTWSVCRLIKLNTRTHSIPKHWLPLLRSLVDHHRSRGSPRTRIAIGSRTWLRRPRWRHELGMVLSGIHHLRVGYHAMRPLHKLWLHCHRPNLALLRRHITLILGVPTILSHLGISRSHKYRLVISHLRGVVNTWICHRSRTGTRRGIGLR